MGNPSWSYQAILKEYIKLCIRNAQFNDRNKWRDIAKKWTKDEKSWKELDDYLEEISKYQPYYIEKEIEEEDENGNVVKVKRILMIDKGKEELENLARKFDEVFWVDDIKEINTGVGIREIKCEIKRRDYQCIIIGMAINNYFQQDLCCDEINAATSGLGDVYRFFGIEEL